MSVRATTDRRPVSSLEVRSPPAPQPKAAETHVKPKPQNDASSFLAAKDIAIGMTYELAEQRKIPAKGVGFDKYPGAPVNPVVIGNAKEGTPRRYEQVIDQFKVGSNPRYTPRGGDTYCNVFATDVCLAMGAPTPQPPYSLSANQYSDWLGKEGKAKGWKAVSADEAQKMANAGKPTLASWKNPKPGASGHIAPVRPGTVDPVKGPTISNAGKTCFDKGNVADGFKSGPQADIKYYVYDPK